MNKFLELDINFIKEADSTILFASFSLLCIKLYNNPNSIVKLPVFLDATCSGLQHLSGLMLDHDVAQHVNLVPKKSDIYNLLVDPINNEINNIGLNDNGEIIVDKAHFLFIKLSRSDIKQPVMTTNYRVSAYGIRDQLASRFKTCKLDKIIKYEIPGIGGPVLLNSTELLIIANIIKKCVFQQFPSLLLIYNYFD
jgi:DNA-directed RNA polymerase